MNEQNQAAKFFREMTRRKFGWQSVADVLILMVSSYLMSIAPGNQEAQLSGLAAFTKEIERRLKVVGLTNETVN
jgi:hypothetical protein